MTDEEINEFMGWLSHTQPTDPESLVVRVRRLVATAVAAEREACAQECLKLAKFAEDRYADDYADGASHCAALIQKRDEL